jgi:hypothetical protein
MAASPAKIRYAITSTGLNLRVPKVTVFTKPLVPRAIQPKNRKPAQQKTDSRKRVIVGGINYASALSVGCNRWI